jgi:hypothetical protein
MSRTPHFRSCGWFTCGPRQISSPTTPARAQQFSACRRWPPTKATLVEGDRSLLAPTPGQEDPRTSPTQLCGNESSSPVIRDSLLRSVRRHDWTGKRKGQRLLWLSRSREGAPTNCSSPEGSPRKRFLTAVRERLRDPASIRYVLERVAPGGEGILPSRNRPSGPRAHREPEGGSNWLHWWRRWESNPRPETLGSRHLHQ